ncbi:rod shape-determining protein MreC, partial [Streptomyces spectabilis]
FTKLDVVGVVVEAPRKDPRDTVLPPKPAKPRPTPTVTVTATPSGQAPADGTERYEQ